MGFGPETVMSTTVAQESDQESRISAIENADVLRDAAIALLTLRNVARPTTGNLSVADCTNTAISNKGQTVENTQTLPTCADGMVGIVRIAVAGVGAFHLKSGASDKIYLDGAALDDGDKVSCATPAVGNSISFLAVEESDGSFNWDVQVRSGNWSDGGA